MVSIYAHYVFQRLRITTHNLVISYRSNVLYLTVSEYAYNIEPNPMAIELKY
jgi:hypothetical protein